MGGGVEVEEWIEEARRYCESEEYCEVNVFEGAEFATHEYPIPDENRKALKWVFVYRQDEIPKDRDRRSPSGPDTREPPVDYR